MLLSVISRLLNICSIELRPGLIPTCSSASGSSALASNRFRITRSDCVHSLSHSFVSEIFWQIAVRACFCLACLHEQAEGECCPLLKMFSLSACVQPLQHLPSTQVGFQPFVWGSDYSGGSRLLSGWSSKLYRPLQYSVNRFRTAVLSIRMFCTAVFDDCWLMLLELGESLGGVVRLLAVSCHHSLLYVLALLLNSLFLCCLHFLPNFFIHFSVL